MKYTTKSYVRVQHVEAVHFENKGTYDVFETKIEVPYDDMYVFLQEGHVHTMRGESFRSSFLPKDQEHP